MVIETKVNLGVEKGRIIFLISKPMIHLFHDYPSLLRLCTENFPAGWW